MIYPGRIIKVGETNAAIVTAIAGALAARGYPSTSPPGVFDNDLKSLVKVFQSQNVDVAGRPLEVDGEVGSMTWGALFGATIAPVLTGSLAVAALGMAVSQLGANSPRLTRLHSAAMSAFPANSQCFSSCRSSL